MATMHSSKGEIRIPDRHNTPEVNTVMLLEMMEEEIVFYLNPPGPGDEDTEEDAQHPNPIYSEEQ